MSLIIDKKLPAFSYLQHASVFEISTERAAAQDIRPLEIGILNLMPSAVVERTETQFLRLLANTPLQIRPTFMYFDSHKSHSSQKHFDSFYRSISEVKERGLDGLIITGANLEQYAFEDVQYWQELTKFFDWIEGHVTSTIFSCWAAHAKLYYSYGISPHKYRQKKFGVFTHRVHHKTGSPFIAGMDDEIFVPHSRWRGVERKDILGKKNLEILVESKEAGPHLVAGRSGRELYAQGHPEYDRSDIAAEYLRDKARGVGIRVPHNYFPKGNDKKIPTKNWGANGQVFYSNWINWVYQTTNVDIKKPLMD
jgi:homoserine O-succinyltransferase/O-acetyltransferase